MRNHPILSGCNEAARKLILPFSYCAGTVPCWSPPVPVSGLGSCSVCGLFTVPFVSVCLSSCLRRQ